MLNSSLYLLTFLLQMVLQYKICTNLTNLFQSNSICPLVLWLYLLYYIITVLYHWRILHVRVLHLLVYFAPITTHYFTKLFYHHANFHTLYKPLLLFLEKNSYLWFLLDRNLTDLFFLLTTCIEYTPYLHEFQQLHNLS